MGETEKQCLKEEEEGEGLDRRRREWERREKVMVVVVAILWMTNMVGDAGSVGELNESLSYRDFKIHPPKIAIEVKYEVCVLCRFLGGKLGKLPSNEFNQSRNRVDLCGAGFCVSMVGL